jgi:DNA-binding response OmpR family regulator
MRLLLIEDDADTADAVVRALAAAGHRVAVERDGPRGLARAQAEPFGLVMLDVMLPGIDGYEICRRLRGASVATPIIMITARDAVHDRVRGLELGADDYLVKPFDCEELVARVRVQLRRDGRHRARDIRVGPLELRSASREVLLDGTPLAVTPREYQILEALAANEGRVLSRGTLQARVWGHDATVPSVVDVHIMALRRKLEPLGGRGLIHTVRGFGYCLRRPVAAS